MKKFFSTLVSELKSDWLEWLKRFGPALLAYLFVRAIYGDTAGAVGAGILLLNSEIVRPLREILTLVRDRAPEGGAGKG
jgi:hypothetical protein